MSAGERIRRFSVPMIDRTAPVAGAVAESGGVISLERLPRSFVDRYLAMLGERRRYRLNRTEIGDLMRGLAGKQIDELLTAYLGRLWSADYALIWRAPPQSSSGEWHHDNVGHRLKLFIVLANDSSENGTEFVPFTHRKRWDTFTGRLPASTGEVRFPPQQAGDVLLFDTNLIHRGRYSATERIILQVEFTHILKSLLVPGACGRFFRDRNESAQSIDAQ